MKRPPVLVLLALVVAMSSSSAIASGITRIRILPNPAVVSDDLQVRIDVEGCDSTSGSALVDSVEREIRVSLSANDFCDTGDPANYVSPRYIPVGPLPLGIWRVNYLSCTNAPPPLPPCQTFRTEVLQVVGELPTTVPLSGLLSVALICAVFGSATFMLWRHRQST